MRSTLINISVRDLCLQEIDTLRAAEKPYQSNPPTLFWQKTTHSIRRRPFFYWESIAPEGWICYPQPMFEYEVAPQFVVSSERFAARLRLPGSGVLHPDRPQLFELGSDGIVAGSIRGVAKFTTILVGAQRLTIRVPPATGAWHLLLKDQECLFVSMDGKARDELQIPDNASNVALLKCLSDRCPALWQKITELEGLSPTLARVVRELPQGKESLRTPAIVILASYDSSGTAAYLPQPGEGFLGLRAALGKMGLWNEDGPSLHVQAVVSQAARIDLLALQGRSPAKMKEIETGVTAEQVRAFLDGGPLETIVGPEQFARLSKIAAEPWMPTTMSPEVSYLLGRFHFSKGPPLEFSHSDQKFVQSLRQIAVGAGLKAYLVPPNGALHGPGSAHTVRITTRGFDRFIESLRADQSKLPRMFLTPESRIGFARALLDGAFEWDETNKQLEFRGNRTICGEVRALLGCFRVYPAGDSPSRVVISDGFDLSEIVAQRLTFEPYRSNRMALKVKGSSAVSPFPEAAYMLAMQRLRDAKITDPDHKKVPDIAAEVKVGYVTLRGWMRRTPQRMERRHAIQPAIKRLLRDVGGA
jgi:hypothetical protein